MNVFKELKYIDNKILQLIDSYADNSQNDYTFDEIALDIHCFQYDFNSFYNNFCLKNKIHRKLNDWTNIPFFNLESFKGKMIPTCIPIVKNSDMYYETSGTTQKLKGKIYRDKFFFPLRSKSIYAQGKQNLFKEYSDKVQIIFLDLPNRRNVTEFSTEYSVLNNFKRHFGNDKSIFLNTSCIKNLEQIVSIIKECYSSDSPLVIISPSYYLSNLLHFIKKNKIRITFPSQGLIMDSGGLKNKAKHKNMSEYLSDLYSLLKITKINYKNTYALSEIGSQFPDFANSYVKEIPSWTRIKIINQHDEEMFFNETGKIVIYDLLNRGNLLGLKTSDTGLLIDKGFIVGNRIIK